MGLWFWLLLIAGALASQAFLWLSSCPLGIPGEWTWHRVPSEPDVWWNLVAVAVTGGLYALYTEAGARRLQRLGVSMAGRLELAAWLSGLAIASFIWLWVVQEASPTRSRLGKAAFVLYYPSSSGYFTKARYVDHDVASLLSGYEELMRERDVLHVGTHPPGLFLIFHGMIGLCERSPFAAALLEISQPASFRKSCDVVAQNLVRSRSPVIFYPLDRQVLWLATLIVMFLGACSVLLVFALLCRFCGIVDSWRTAALWPALPAVAIFIPKSDVALSFVGLAIVLTWLVAVDRRSIILSLAAGSLAWCGLMLSLALLPVFLFTAVVSIMRRYFAARESETSLSDDDPERNSARQSRMAAIASLVRAAPPASCLFGGVTGFSIPVLFMMQYAQINLPTIWWLNYQNHAGFYQQYARTYWKWLIVNPVELTFAAGWPVFLIAISSICIGIRSRSVEWASVAWSVALVWGMLWLTGKNSGEAARLWILFLPWLVWLAAPIMSRIAAISRRHWLRPELIVLIIQLAVCALTVCRVNGFVLDV